MLENSQIIKKAYLARARLGLNKLRIDSAYLEKLLKEQHYTILTYSQASELFEDHEDLKNSSKKYKSFSCRLGGKVHIFYTDGLVDQQKLKIFAHELGHIECDHLCLEFTQEMENEANEFAIYFLSPICYLALLHINCIDDLKQHTILPDDECEKILGKISDFTKNYDEYSPEEKMVCESIGLPKKEEKKEPEIIIPVPTTTIVNQNLNIKELLKSHASSIYKAVGSIVAVVVLAVIITQMVSLQKSVAELSQAKSESSSQSAPTQTVIYMPQSIPESSDASESSTSQSADSETSASSEFSQEPESRIVSSVESEGLLVYVTTSGKKYHKWGCQYIKNKTNLIDMYLSEAQDKGYTACSVCF